MAQHVRSSVRGSEKRYKGMTWKGLNMETCNTARQMLGKKMSFHPFVYPLVCSLQVWFLMTQGILFILTPKYLSLPGYMC